MQFPFSKIFIVLSFATVSICFSANVLTAQTNKPEPEEAEEELQPLRSGVAILAFTGNLRWRNFFIPRPNGLQEESQTELQIEFRNIKMLNPRFGLGYRLFGTAFISGFFEGGGLGGFGGGPLARFYPLKTTRWQPYVQGNVLAGFNAALGDAIGINDVNGFRYRTGLRAGLGYKFSNAFGIFFEIGPSWEYGEGFQLDSRAIQFNVGIELFRF